LGNPNTGEIYEGALRDPGDVPLTEAQAEMLRSLPVRDRMAELSSLREQITEKIVESAAELAKPQPPEQPELVRLVTAALEARNYKPRCTECSSIGWATTYVHPVPIVNKSMTGEVITSALLVCGKCGAQREHSLNVLGITVTPQERRVITPDQIQPKQPLIVAP
jgi:hypothetical protein